MLLRIFVTDTLTWLLISLHQVTSYNYLPKNELPLYSYGSRHTLHKYLATLTDIPFHVLIVYNNLYCSGALIRSKIVITTATCLLTDKIRRPVVKIGAESVTGNGQIIPVVEIKIHEYYRYMSRIDNDVALLVLKEDVEFSDYVKKTVIVEPETALRTGVTVVVSGWGSTNLPQNFVNQLIWTEMTVIDKSDCGIMYKHLLTPSNFCAKYQPVNTNNLYQGKFNTNNAVFVVNVHQTPVLNKNMLHHEYTTEIRVKRLPTAQPNKTSGTWLLAKIALGTKERRLSDSGGPAVYNKELLVGILSYGGISNEEPYIAILTNISYFHRWILLNTKRFLDKYCVPRRDLSYSLQSSEDQSYESTL